MNHYSKREEERNISSIFFFSAAAVCSALYKSCIYFRTFFSKFDFFSSKNDLALRSVTLFELSLG